MTLLSWILEHTNGHESVVELGCGHGNYISKVKAKNKIGIDAHFPYLQKAKKGFTKIHGNMRNYRDLVDPMFYDCVILIDAIEHLNKEEALELIHNLQHDFKKILIFTPSGEFPQTEDVFKTGGDYWQTHRSTWFETEFQELGFRAFVYDNGHHPSIYAEWGK